MAWLKRLFQRGGQKVEQSPPGNSRVYDGLDLHWHDVCPGGPYCPWDQYIDDYQPHHVDECGFPSDPDPCEGGVCDWTTHRLCNKHDPTTWDYPKGHHHA